MRRNYGPPNDYVCVDHPEHQGLAHMERGDTLADFECGTCGGKIRGRKRSGEVECRDYDAARVKQSGLSASVAKGTEGKP